MIESVMINEQDMIKSVQKECGTAECRARNKMYIQRREYTIDAQTELCIPAVTAAWKARSCKNCFGLITGRRSLRARRTGGLFQIFLQTMWEMWRKRTT